MSSHSSDKHKKMGHIGKAQHQYQQWYQRPCLSLILELLFVITILHL